MEGDPGTQLSVQSEQPHRINISLPAAGALLLHARDVILALSIDCTAGQADFFRVL